MVIKNNLFIVAFYLLTLFSFTSFGNKNLETKNPLTVKIKSIPEKINANENFNMSLLLSLPDGYHAYEDKFQITVLKPEGFKMSVPKITPLKEWFDKFSKKNRKGIEKEATVSFLLEAPNKFNDHSNELVLRLSYQACTDSFCLFPKTLEVKTNVIFVDSNSPTTENTSNSEAINQPDSNSKFNILDSENFTKLLNQSWGLALILAFLAGILTSFTPCIFPMIPITMAILTKGSESRSRLSNFLVSLFYVHGIATTYSIMGLIAASSGSLFGSALSNKYVLFVICCLFLLMAISMYGAFEIQVPSFIRNKFGAGTKKTGFLGAYISGAFAGLVASPCVGPVLVTILTYVSTQKDHVFGFFLLFTYAMGLGLIFLLLGAFTELTRKLPKSGSWMEATKFVLGSLMLFAFFYYLNFLVSERIFHILLGVGLVVIGSLYGAFKKITMHPNKKEYLKKGFMQSILIIGFVYLIFGIFNIPALIQQSPSIIKDSEGRELNTQNLWKKYSDDNIKQALQNKQPIIIDFYADWCAACHELDEHVFSKPEFYELTKNTSLLKFDATQESELLKTLKTKYQIQGLPTIIFINSKGEWRKDLTLTEFENIQKFTDRFNKL